MTRVFFGDPSADGPWETNAPDKSDPREGDELYEGYRWENGKWKKQPKTYIPVYELVHGAVYRIHARNFHIGMWNENAKGFIGVREKFKRRYLATEYHWDTGGSAGTAQPIEMLIDRDFDYTVATDFGPVCEEHTMECRWVDSAREWRHVKNGFPFEVCTSKATRRYIPNDKLLEYMEGLTHAYGD